MVGKNIDPHNVYELMENDDGEVMVLLYAGNTNPLNPSFRLNKVRKCIELKRNNKDVVLIEGLKPESIEKLDKLEVLYVCELKYTENADDSEILFAYPAELKNVKIGEMQEKVENSQEVSNGSLSEKAKQVREKVLNKK